MNTAYISHPSCLAHDMGHHHPECPQRVAVIADRLLGSGLLDYMAQHEAPAVTEEQILRAHTEGHWAQLQSMSPKEGLVAVDPDTYMSPRTLEAALHSAGAAVLATDLVMRGEVKRAFCNVRPPGHHAEHGQPMGFCFLNNVAIGVRHALAAHGVKRAVLVDFDVHHGNGSEDILAGDSAVLMVSTFQSQLYPFSGDIPRASNMCNIGLPPYSDGTAMREAVETHWVPAIERFEPEIMFISAGFDAHREDELSMVGWRDQDYAWLSARLVALANSVCAGRIVSTLEGGYHLPALARCVELHVRSLLEID